METTSAATRPSDTTESTISGRHEIRNSLTVTRQHIETQRTQSGVQPLVSVDYCIVDMNTNDCKTR
jgi:hypothetical protein